VGPAGASPAQEPTVDVRPPDPERSPPEDDERLLREVPPHHG